MHQFPGVIEGKGSRKQAEIYTETFDQSINNKHVKTSLENFDGSGSSEHSDSNPGVFDGSGSSTDSEGLIDVCTGGKRAIRESTLGSDNNNYSNTDTNGTRSILAPAERSSSSFSSESSSNDFFQVEQVKITESVADRPTVRFTESVASRPTARFTESVASRPTARFTESVASRPTVRFNESVASEPTVKFTESVASRPASKDEQSDVSSESSVESEVDNSSPVCTSASQVYIVTHDHMGMSPTLSPPVQVMDRSSEYDSYRIPSSVFSRNTSPMEWSIASNESLFSIHIGDPSLSRDHGFMSKELGKSGELTKSGELNKFSPLPSVLIENTDTGRKSVETQTTEMSDEAFKLEERLGKDQKEVKNSHSAGSCNVSNDPSHSPGSGTSAYSNASPIKKSGWPLCYCFNCSSAFYYCKCPSCYHLTWPSCSCSNCSWAFCHCWNCSYKRCCCHTSPVLTEVEKLRPMKTDIPRQQSYEEASMVASSSTSCCNWLQCFSCSCCTWGNCCCCRCCSNWFQCFSWSCCKSSNCCRCRCCSNWFQCISWSRCKSGNCYHCHCCSNWFQCFSLSCCKSGNCCCCC